MKRTRYVVHCPEGHIARFSLAWHAYKFAESVSSLMPSHLIELSDPSGLVGQYLDGHPTPEFKQHHIAGIWR